MEPYQIYLITAIPVILCPVLLWLGIRSLRRKRLVEDVPTSKVEGVFIGLTELKGTAETPSPLVSYLAEEEVVFYRFSVEEHWQKTETYTDSEGQTRTRTRSGWTTVRSDEVRRTFFLKDDTGEIRIQPDNAQIDADRIFSRSCSPWDPLYYEKGPYWSISHSTHRRRFTEHAIRMHTDLYVMGHASLREDIVAPEIGYDPEDEMYLISTGSEEEIVKGYGWKAVGGILFGWLFGFAAPIVYQMLSTESDFPTALSGTLLITLPFTFCYGVAVFLLYLQLIYNGLIQVKNRLERAFSLIDIELKRRHDLIPNLVSLVKAAVKHEGEVHTQVAKLRTQAFSGRSAPGLPDEAIALVMAGAANQQTSVLKELFTYVERYPEIKTQDSFLKLSEQLARTERKIALARTFYNDSVTVFNDRQQTMPDVLIAKPLRMKEASYLKIEEFEKAPVEVRFEAEEVEEAPDPHRFDGEETPDGATKLSAQEMAALRAERPDDEPAVEEAPE